MLCVAPRLLYSEIGKLAARLEGSKPGKGIMLPPLIIEQIRKREEEDRRRREHQPAIELPIPSPYRPSEESSGDGETDRGVVVIDLM